MIAPSTPTRAHVVTALALLAAGVLAIPSAIEEGSPPPAAVLSAGPGAQPADARIGAAPAAVGPARVSAPSAPRHGAALSRPGMAGMVVGIDPETGEVGMPTPEQMEKLAGSAPYQIDHSSAGLVEVHHPDGSVSVDLQGRFQEYETVRIGPDGKKTFQCLDGKPDAVPPPPPAPEER